MVTEPQRGNPVAEAERGPEPPGTADAGPGRRRVRWEGWVGFGGVLMAIVGGFAVIEGLIALLAPDFFVTGGGRVLALNLTGWGWLHLLLGLLVLVTGLSLLGGAAWARGVGAALIAINMFVQLVWLPAFPLWSIIIIAFDLLVLYAIATTWRDWRVAR
jgi:hypothetical protein